MDRNYDSLVEELATTVLSGHAFNQYACHHNVEIDLANTIRRQNLRLYLEDMSGYKSKILLVGEAAGYRGCRLTGIPFTSERILVDGIYPLKTATVNDITLDHMIFGIHRGYRKTNEKKGVTNEATATITWNVLSEFWPPPILWNAYPFHPYRPGEPNSNRSPTRAELDIGRHFLTEIIHLFDIKKIIAAGRKASEALSYTGFFSHQVRHPSHGGKHQFTARIQTILGSG